MLGQAFFRALLSFLFVIMVAQPMLSTFYNGYQSCGSVPDVSLCQFASLGFITMGGMLSLVFLVEMMGIGAYLRYRSQITQNAKVTGQG